MADLEGTRARLRAGGTRADPAGAAAAESPDLIARLELDGTFSRVNDAAARLLGWTPATLLGRRLTDLAHPDDRSIVAVRLEHAGAGGGHGQTVAFRGRRVDGGWAHLETRIEPERDADGRVVGLASATRDVTARREAERRAHARLREEAALGRAAAAVARGAGAEELCAIAATEAATMLGADCGVVFLLGPGRSLRRVAAGGPDDAPAAVDAPADVPLDAETPLARAFATAEPCPPLAYATLPGPTAAELARSWHSGAAAPLVADGRPVGVIGVLARDDEVLEPGCEAALARLAELLVAGAAHRPPAEDVLVDAPTGLYTRAGLVRRLEEEIARARRRGDNLCLAVVDVRPAPAALAAGDRREAARIARRVARASDVVARLDEGRVAWLLPECDPADAERAIARLRAALAGAETAALRSARVEVGLCDLAHEAEPRRLLERASIRASTP
jgi:PAS domain S-box-containing protein